MEDPFAVGKFINYHRSIQDKSRKELAFELGVTVSRVTSWEIGCSGSAILPSEELLPTIARFLSVDLEVLKNIYEVSRRGRIQEKDAKRSARYKPKNKKDASFSGEIGNRKILRVTNSQLSSIRFGRK